MFILHNPVSLGLLTCSRRTHLEQDQTQLATSCPANHAWLAVMCLQLVGLSWAPDMQDLQTLLVCCARQDHSTCRTAATKSTCSSSTHCKHAQHKHIYSNTPRAASTVSALQAAVSPQIEHQTLQQTCQHPPLSPASSSMLIISAAHSNTQDSSGVSVNCNSGGEEMMQCCLMGRSCSAHTAANTHQTVRARRSKCIQPHQSVKHM